MFVCPECGGKVMITRCNKCGWEPRVADGMILMTEDPGIMLDGSEKYIGYDGVGEFYEGRHWLDIKPSATAVCRVMSETLAGDAPFLDLGCGLGTYSIPIALMGHRVIAADISIRMLSLLKRKALLVGCDMTMLTIVRMNALSLPIPDESMGCAMVNSVLHLISNPMRVINELHRVLTPGGCLFLGVNSPGVSKERDQALVGVNADAARIMNLFHKSYWEKARTMGHSDSRLSWSFDQFKACLDVFGNMETMTIPYYERTTRTLEDGFLYRMRGKGFSDQQGIDTPAHETAYAWAHMAASREYGPDYADTPITEIIDGIELRVYIKE